MATLLMKRKKQVDIGNVWVIRSTSRLLSKASTIKIGTSTAISLTNAVSLDRL